MGDREDRRVIVRPCGWSKRIQPNAVGIEIETDFPLGDSAEIVVATAKVKAYKDAATRIYKEFIREYNKVNCKKPCKKDWYVDIKGLSLGAMLDSALGKGIVVRNENITPPLKKMLQHLYLEHNTEYQSLPEGILK